MGAAFLPSECFDSSQPFTYSHAMLPGMWLRLELNVLQPGVFRIDDVRITKMDDRD